MSGKDPVEAGIAFEEARGCKVESVESDRVA